MAVDAAAVFASAKRNDTLFVFGSGFLVFIGAMGMYMNCIHWVFFLSFLAEGDGEAEL